MRFLKIFLVAFFSLIGTVALIVGGMYLFGALTPKKVDPESIYFEYQDGKTEFYFSNDDSYIKINTPTQDVTVKNITLSFVDGKYSDNQPDGSGYISNGIIKVPQKVVIGQAFKVQLVKENNAELGGIEWIKGGKSVLKATSESLQASNIQTTINVDVPVKSITIKTYESYDFETQQCANEKNSFASGETFFAEAKFLPTSSQYKYGLESLGTKNVYFDITDNLENTVAVNEPLCKDFASGKNNVIAFTALKASPATKISGYVFSDIAVEEQIIKQKNNDTDAILQELKTNYLAYKVSNSQDVSFVSVSVDSVSVAQGGTKILNFNEINKIYANYGSSNSSLNFGIQISGIDSVSGVQHLQSQIADVKLSVLIKSGDKYDYAIEGQDFWFVDKANKVIEAVDNQYSPIVVSDINRSYWNFVPLLDNAVYAFEISLKDLKSAKTLENSQVWKSSVMAPPTALSWKDASPVAITVIDSVDPNKVTSEEFDLETILNFEPGTYSTVKFIAYEETGAFDLTNIISKSYLPTIKYENTMLDLQDHIKIYELDSSVIKLQPTLLKSFNVRAVVLKTDFDNKLTGREVVAYTTDLAININKTVQNLSVNIEISDPMVLKNLPTEDETNKTLTKLAFAPTSVKQKIFDLVFTVVNGNNEMLKNDAEIFLNDFNSGKIYIDSQVSGLQKKILIFENDEEGVFVSPNTWQYRVQVYTVDEVESDVEIRFELVYQQSSKSVLSEFVKNVSFASAPEFNGVTFSSEVTSALLDIYDGKIYSLEFAHDNTISNPLREETLVTDYNLVNIDGQDVNVANVFERRYLKLVDDAWVLADDVANDDGSYKIIAKDKYDNAVDASRCRFYPLSSVQGPDFALLQCATVFAPEYSSSLKAQGKPAPTDNLYFSSQHNTSTKVRANEGQVETGSWHKSNYQNYSVVDESKEITITRYGYQGSQFAINGQDGLLSVVYKQGDEEYELCNVLKYILPSLEGYKNVVELTEVGGQLTINIFKSLAQDISLKITATSELGVSYAINLIIEKNINIKLTRVTAQAQLEEQNANNQFCLYSNNLVEYKLQVTYTCKENNSNSGVMLYLSKGSFSGSREINNHTFTTNEFTYKDKNAVSEQSFYINFSSAELGERKVVLTTASGNPLTHEFSSEIIFDVLPNIMFTTGDSITKNVIIDSIEYKAILSQSELQTTEEVNNTLIKRIVGSEAINISELSVAFEKDNQKDAVYLTGSTNPLSENIFNVNSNPATLDKQICLLNDKTMLGVYSENGEYYAILSIKYGSYKLGNMRVNLGSSITPNYSSSYAPNRFVLYNGKVYLALVGGETITLLGSSPNTEYIKNLFTINDAQGGFDIVLNMDVNLASSDTQNNIYQIYPVSDYIISTASQDIVLTLTHKTSGKEVASIQFPVIIMPFGADYVKYQHVPTFGNKPVAQNMYLTDMTNLNNYQQLSLVKAEDMDTFNCGTTISLFQTPSQNFGLSQEILSKLSKANEHKLKLFIKYAGPQGQITDATYSNYIDTNGQLKLNSSVNDIILYAVLQNDAGKQLGLYRFLAKADVKINVNYPYATQGENDYAEYVDKGEVKLQEIFDKEFPNYNKKRVELNYLTNGEELSDYTVEYSIFSVDGKENLSKGVLLTQYGLNISDDNKTLYIHTTNPNTVVLKANIIQHNLPVGTAFYTLEVNKKPQTTFVLHDKDNNIYNDESKTINSGEVYDFSEYTLFSQSSDQSWSTLVDGLKYYYYIIDNPDSTSTFLTLNDKKLKLNEDKAVSDKVVNFVYYTIYGPVLKTTLTFKAEYDYKNTGDKLTEISKGNYELLADIEFKFEEEFKVQKNDEYINLKNVVYYLDGLSDGKADIGLSFDQSQSGKTHSIKVVAKLEGKNNLAEDFVFTINITVKPSITSTHKTIGTAFKLDDIVYNPSHKTNGLALNQIFSNNPDIDALFKVENFDVLNGYSLKIVASSECADYLSFNYSTEGVSVSELWNGTDYVCKALINKSPNINNLSVDLTFTLIKNQKDVISAKLKFVVLPDIIVTLNYPQPNAQVSSLDYEARFLAEDGDSNFLFATGETYFGELKRVTLSDRENNPIVDNNRVKVRAKASGAVRVNNDTVYEFSNFEQSVKLSWYNSGVQNNLKGEINFEITIDGDVHKTYKMIFFNDINKLFTIDNIYNLYQNNQENNEALPEVFFARNADKGVEAIFSHNTAMLTFKSKGGKMATLTAYLMGSSPDNIIGQLQIGSSPKEYNWLLVNTLKDSAGEYRNIIKEDMSNVIIKAEIEGEDDYEFTLNTPNKIIETGTPKLTYRLNLMYLDSEKDKKYKVDYENVARILQVDTDTVASYSPVLTKAVDDGVIGFNIGGQTLSKNYYYNVVFDFKCEANDKLSITAGTTYESGNNLFGITTLNNEQFTPEYFLKNGVYYFAELAMVTKVGFEQSQTMDNVIYASNTRLAILADYFKNFNTLTAKTSIYQQCVGVARTPIAQDMEQFFDFELTGLGAENAGNYAYILVTYSTIDISTSIINAEDIDYLAYALVKVLVKPTDSIKLINTTKTPNGENDVSRQMIRYDKTTEKFSVVDVSGKTVSELVLGRFGSDVKDNDLIFVQNTDGKNAIVPSSTTTAHQTELYLYGDIAEYAYLDVVHGVSATLKQKEGAVAHYGNKEGYILVKDMYGFEKKYYLTLEALADNFALSLPNGEDENGVFINTIEEIPNAFYSGTELVVVDADETAALGSKGAIRVINFAQIKGQGWNYKIKYQLLDIKTDEVIFASEELANSTLFELPTLKEDQKEVTLKIIITIIQSPEVQENVTLTTSMKIQKRFVLTSPQDDGLASVQSGVEFGLDNFFTIQDVANTNVNLGQASMSGKTLTLIIKESEKDNISCLYATHISDPTKRFNVNIKVGEDLDGNVMDAVEIGAESYYIYPLGKYNLFESVNFDYYRFSLSGQLFDHPINLTNCQFVADKIVYLSTSKLKTAETVYVKIQKDIVYYVPFTLDKNGTQQKSLMEVIANKQLFTNLNSKLAYENSADILNAINENVIQSEQDGSSAYYSTSNKERDFYSFKISTTPVEVHDLNKIKNFSIYDDNIELKIKKGDAEDITSIEYTVVVKDGEQVLGRAEFKVLQNIDHTRYISLYSIIGETLDPEKEYTIEIQVDSFDKLTPFIFYGDTQIASDATINFKCAVMTTDDNETTNKDVLSVDSEKAFDGGRIYQIPKSYVIKFIDQDILEQVKVNFNVTPRYYAIDNYKTETTAVRTIYANQYKIKDGKYVIEFNTWANQFNLINLAGDTLASLNNGIGLDFKVTKGSGIINTETKALETNVYNFGDNFIISVSVEVVEGKYVYIGQVYVNIDRDNVYVSNLATYLMTIQHPNESTTLNVSYTFTQKLVSIDDLILNNDSIHIVNGQIEFDNDIYAQVGECNIEIITVIQDIYSAEYYYNLDDKKEYLQVKLKLNEISSTYGRSVALNIQAKALNGDYNSEENKTYTISETEYLFNDTNLIQTKDPATDVLTVYIPFETLSSFNAMVKEDYTYAVKIVSTGSTNSKYLYVGRDIAFEDIKHNHLLFAFSFDDNNGNNKKTLLAVKKPEKATDGELFKNDGYFTINIESIPIIAGIPVLIDNVNQISGSSITYLGDFDMDLVSNCCVLLSVQEGDITYYSLGSVNEYSTNNPFEICITSNDFYGKLMGSKKNIKVALYETSDIYTFPTGERIPGKLELNILNGQKVFGVYTSTQDSLAVLAVNNCASQCNVDLSSILQTMDANNMLTLVDYTGRVLDKVDENVKLWKFINSDKYINVNVSKIADIPSYKLYEFGFNIANYISSNGRITAVDETIIDSETINLASIIKKEKVVIEEGYYYNFRLDISNKQVQFFAIKAQDGKLLYTPPARGVYTFTYQNIVNKNLLTDGLAKYELKDKNGNLIGVYCVEYRSENGLLEANQNPMFNNAYSATLITGDTLTLNCNSETMTYFVKNNNEYLVVTGRNSFDFDLSSLGKGGFMAIKIAQGGFENFPENGKFTLYVAESDTEQEFKVLWGGATSTITIEEYTTQKLILSEDLAHGTTGDRLTVK